MVHIFSPLSINTNVIIVVSVYINSLGTLGVPGYSNHSYNVLNLAYYIAATDTMGDGTNVALSVWANPQSYFLQTFRDSITGKSGSTDAEFRAAIKGMHSVVITLYVVTFHYINIVRIVRKCWNQINP